MTKSIFNVYEDTNAKWLKWVQVVLHHHYNMCKKIHLVNKNISGTSIIDHSTSGNATIFLDK